VERVSDFVNNLVLVSYFNKKPCEKNLSFALGGMGSPDITCCYPRDGAMLGLVRKLASLDFLSRKNGAPVPLVNSSLEE